MLQIKGNERGTYVTCDPRLTVGQKAIFFFAIEDMIGTTDEISMISVNRMIRWLY